MVFALFGAKTKPIGGLEIGLMPPEIVIFGLRNFKLRDNHVLTRC